MDVDALISEIYRRVQERVSACEAESGTADNQIAYQEASDKPVLGVLAQDHGEICHPTYTDSELSQYYTMKCALLDEAWDVENWEGMIAYNLTNEAVGKIVNGIFDTKYTKTFGKALLLGKKIFVPEEEVELYRYRETAPKGYFGKLEANLDFLKENGVEIVPNEKLCQVILGREKVPESAEKTLAAAKEKTPAISLSTEQMVEGKTITFSRRVLSERDLILAKQNHVARILITGKTIVTDLAKDYAKKYHIVIVM